MAVFSALAHKLAAHLHVPLCCLATDVGSVRSREPRWRRCASVVARRWRCSDLRGPSVARTAPRFPLPAPDSCLTDLLLPKRAKLLLFPAVPQDFTLFFDNSESVIANSLVPLLQRCRGLRSEVPNCSDSSAISRVCTSLSLDLWALQSRDLSHSRGLCSHLPGREEENV